MLEWWHELTTLTTFKCQFSGTVLLYDCHHHPCTELLSHKTEPPLPIKPQLFPLPSRCSGNRLSTRNLLTGLLWESQVIGIVQYFSFGDWHISLSTMCSSFIHGVAYQNSLAF